MSHTLRDLPLPVKVVASVFLLAVGAGYTSAMLQLHIQDSKSGKPMPTVDDVVLKFTGKKRFDPNAPPPPAPVSRLEALITSETVDITGATMAGAFTTHDRAKGEMKFANATKGKPPHEVEAIKAHRKGEQEVVALWARAPDAQRKAAYEADKFVPPAGKMPAALTPALKDGDAVKIKTLIDARCVTCHSKGGEKEDPALDTYAGLAKFMLADAAPPQPVNGFIKVEEPISVSKLTQSTHAHLLSFATLFSLTGLIFALSSWPVWIRVIVGPWVVIAVFADVSLWWLARLCDAWGPYFAMGVILTGFLAGVGLFAQISGSLFNMYGWKGKGVIALLFVLGALGGGAFVMKLLVPALPKPKVEEKQAEEKKSEGKKPEDKKGPDGGPKTDGGAPGDGAKGAPAVVAPRPPINELDRLLTWPPVAGDGKPLPPESIKFKGGDDGTMTPAFFEKDKEYKKVMDGSAPQAEKDKLKAHRQGDLDTMLAWVRSPEPVRKSSYEANKFDLPGLSDKALTPSFVKDGKVMIKTLIDNRCATCHSEGGKQGDYPLDTYAGLSAYLAPAEAPKVDEKPAEAPKVDEKPGAPAPPAAKPADPIPPAKDD